MTDREYDKRKEKLDVLFNDFLKCILKMFEDDPKYMFRTFKAYSSTFLLASVPIDRNADVTDNLNHLKIHNDEVYLNAMANMIKGLTDPDSLNDEFTVHFDDED